MLPPMRADDPFLDRYAHGTRAMTASEIRALFAVASRPEVVSLAGGMPFTAALPFDVIGEVTTEVLAQEGPAALQYGGGQGDPRLREVLVELMGYEGIHASGEDVVVTIGSQQALDLLARMFCDPGDVIVAEGPSYVGALSAFSQYQVEVRHVALDDAGLDPEALGQALARLDREGKRVKFLYTVPNFHNPAGVTMSTERRGRVLELARRHNVLVVEDNPYGRLGFESDPPSAMLAKAIAARVAYVPGGAFYADGQGASHMRLSYCFPNPERIREGIRRLAGVIAQELDLVRALGGVPTPAEEVDRTPPTGWGGA